MKVLSFGSINIDYVYQVSHIVLPGETISSRDLLVTAGGKGANQSVALAKSGLDVYHAGKIGINEKWILEKVENFGVKTELIDISEGTTGHAIIQVSDNGENSIVLYQGLNHKIDKHYINKVFASFSTGDMLIIQNEINNLDIIIEKAKSKGLKVCFNPAPYSPEIHNLQLKSIDYLILNEIEGLSLVGGDCEPDEVLYKLSSNYPNIEIVLTLGEDGVIAISNGKRYKAGIFPVTTVDTTAAGDTFVGYYISARSKQMPIQDSLELACKASSITVTKKGAMDSIPYFKDL